MNNYLDIILAPVITEKTAGMEAEGKYAFKVANKANKTEVKQAIEKRYQQYSIFGKQHNSIHTF